MAGEPSWEEAAEPPSLDSHAGVLEGRPLLITSDDGFRAGRDALAEASGHWRSPWLRLVHFPTDRSYSDHWRGLQSEILNWLELMMSNLARDRLFAASEGSDQ